MSEPKPIETNEQPAISEKDTAATPNEYTYNGYTIRETFDPDGPRFSDCIIRLFA